MSKKLLERWAHLAGLLNERTPKPYSSFTGDQGPTDDEKKGIVLPNVIAAGGAAAQLLVAEKIKQTMLDAIKAGGIEGDYSMSSSEIQTAAVSSTTVDVLIIKPPAELGRGWWINNDGVQLEVKGGDGRFQASDTAELIQKIDEDDYILMTDNSSTPTNTQIACTNTAIGTQTINVNPTNPDDKAVFDKLCAAMNLTNPTPQEFLDTFLFGRSVGSKTSAQIAAICDTPRTDKNGRTMIGLKYTSFSSLAGTTAIPVSDYNTQWKPKIQRDLIRSRVKPLADGSAPMYDRALDYLVSQLSTIGNANPFLAGHTGNFNITKDQVEELLGTTNPETGDVCFGTYQPVGVPWRAILPSPPGEKYTLRSSQTNTKVMAAAPAEDQVILQGLEPKKANGQVAFKGKLIPLDSIDDEGNPLNMNQPRQKEWDALDATGRAAFKAAALKRKALVDAEKASNKARYTAFWPKIVKFVPSACLNYLVLQNNFIDDLPPMTQIQALVSKLQGLDLGAETVTTRDIQRVGKMPGGVMNVHSFSRAEPADLAELKRIIGVAQKSTYGVLSADQFTAVPDAYKKYLPLAHAESPWNSLSTLVTAMEQLAQAGDTAASTRDFESVKELEEIPEDELPDYIGGKGPVLNPPEGTPFKSVEQLAQKAQEDLEKADTKQIDKAHYFRGGKIMKERRSLRFLLNEAPEMLHLDDMNDELHKDPESERDADDAASSDQVLPESRIRYTRSRRRTVRRSRKYSLASKLLK